jgi:hypothetical protein
MKESYGKGAVPHTDLKSCVTDRKVRLKALTKACAGLVLSREIKLVRGADAVEERGRPHWAYRQSEIRLDPARSLTRRMYRNNLRENREVPWIPVRSWAGRLRKSKDRSWE